MVPKAIARSTLVILMLCTASAARAQEPQGAGRVEIDSALFGGGVLRLSNNNSAPQGYVFDVAAAANITRRMGMEGDFAWAIARQQALALPGSTTAAETRAPNMLFYTANLVFNPLGHDRPIIPYVDLGGGAVSVLTAPETFGIASNSTHLAANVGGGVRWFMVPHWGLRGDYRFIVMRNGDATAPGAAPIRRAQRFYGALVLTF